MAAYLAQTFGQGQRLHGHVLGDHDGRHHRPGRDRHTGRPGRLQVDVVGQRAQALDQPQPSPGGDHVGVDDARTLADQELELRQGPQDLVLARAAHHGHGQLRRRRLQGLPLMPLAAVGHK